MAASSKSPLWQYFIQPPSDQRHKFKGYNDRYTAYCKGCVRKKIEEMKDREREEHMARIRINPELVDEVWIGFVRTRTQVK
jgi:hypothetical protein